MRRKRSFSKKMLIVSVLAIVMSISMIFSVWGYSGGRWDRAKTGCECHSLTADLTVSVDITGLPAEYIPGQSYLLTITVSGGSAFAKGGFNLEVSSGKLSPNDSNTQVNIPQNQTTHTNSNQRSWTVNWEAPTSGTGDVTFWVAGNAVDGSGNSGGDGWNLNTYVVSEAPLIDTQPPEISSVKINGAVSQTYPLSSIPTLTLTATIDDSNTGNSDIAGANFTEEMENWETSQSMNLQNPPTSPTEIFVATITPPTAAGSYGYFVYGWDDVPNYNSSNAKEYARLTITDDVAPRITNVAVDGEAGKAVLEGTIINLTATLSESVTGHAEVAGANFTIGPSNWSSSIPMNSQDGFFDEISENVNYALDTSDWLPGSYDLYVYGWDDVPNYNTTSVAFATLVITTDLEPPEIFNVTLNGAPTLNLLKGENVILRAELDDIATGFSNIGGANYTVFEKNFISSVTMNSLDSTFDEVYEIVEISIDTTSWDPGTYKIYVYGFDAASPVNNHNTTSSSFATLVIQSPPQGVVVASGKEKGTLEIGWDADITATFSKYNIYRSGTQGGPYTLVGNASSTETSFFDTGLEEGKTYYYVLTGVDSQAAETGFSEEASATVGEDAEPEEGEEFPVIIPIIALVILIIIIILLYFMRKRYAGES
jgi:hypothetical protein